MEFYENDGKRAVNKPYSGPERRNTQRRRREDRREEIRLELGKAPRRCGVDRRSHSYLWNMPQNI